MDVYSLTDPVNPVLLGTLQNPGFFTVHEVYVRNDTAYCANGYNGLWIYNMKYPATPSLISIMDTYPESGYNHSAWLTGNSKTMVFTDENHGKGVKIFDMTDITDPQLVGMVRSNLLHVSDPASAYGRIAHNPYIVGNILFVSYYHDGVQAFDISDPSNPQLVGYHSTYPEAVNYSYYAGCWGLYPFLPSGNIIASDINNGLFILDGKSVLNYQSEVPLTPAVTLGMNPVHDNLEIFFISGKLSSVTVELFDVTGKLVLMKTFDVTEGPGSISMPVYTLSGGIYVANIINEQFNLISKIIKLHN
jgi:hypothetical protein